MVLLTAILCTSVLLPCRLFPGPGSNVDRLQKFRRHEHGWAQGKCLGDPVRGRVRESEVQPVGWIQGGRGLLGAEFEPALQRRLGAGLTRLVPVELELWLLGPRGPQRCWRRRRGGRRAVLGESTSSQKATLPDKPLWGPPLITWEPNRVCAGWSVTWLAVGPWAGGLSLDSRLLCWKVRGTRERPAHLSLPERSCAPASRLVGSPSPGSPLSRELSAPRFKDHMDDSWGSMDL